MDVSIPKEQAPHLIRELSERDQSPMLMAAGSKDGANELRTTGAKMRSQHPLDECFLGVTLDQDMDTGKTHGRPPSRFFSHNSPRE